MWRALATVSGFALRLLGRQAPLFVAALVLSAAVAGGAYGFANYLYDRHIEQSSEALKTLSVVISDHANRSMLAVNQSVSRVVDALQAAKPGSVGQLESLADSPEIRALLDDIVIDNPFLDSVFVIGADGQVDQRSRYGMIPADLIAGADYLAALKHARPGAFQLSTPFESYQFHTWMLNYSRRVSAPDGSFLGAVAGIVKLSAFSNLFDKINLQSKGSIALIGAEGDLLTWAPQAELPFGPSIGGTDAYETFVRPRREGVTEAASRYDGVERLLAFAPAPDFPVTVMIAMGKPDVIAAWAAEAGWIARTAALALLAIWLGAVRLAFKLERHAERREQRMLDDERAEQTSILSNAIENISQGLAMFDAGGALRLYNTRYAQMYGLPEQELTLGVAREELQARLHRNGLAKAFERAANEPDGSVLSYNHLKDGRVIAQRKKPLPDGGWISTHEDVTERRAADRRIHELAARDALTGLFNRFEFRERLEKRLEEQQRDNVRFALFHFDLDRFKTVNDIAGRHNGDEALRQAAHRLQKLARPEDLAFRLGGDEFALIRRLDEGQREATRLAERLVAAFDEPFHFEASELVCGASLGVALIPGDGEDVETVARNAELALRHAKHKGRGRYAFYAPSMHEEVASRVKLEQDLKIAIAARQFELHYQPIVAVKDRRLAAFEALIRWRHPERGLVLPGEFIAVCEETGLIVEIGDWALREVSRQAATWPAEVKVSVNVSPVQVRSPGFAAAVASALDEAGLAGSRLIAEITETVLIDDADQAVATLQAIKALGVAVAMDDFGSGYSSLSYLRKFPFDKLKIDKSFVGALGADPSAATIVRGAIGLAHALGIVSIAEGIETEEQMAFLVEAGCAEAQGYLISRPMPAPDADALVARDFPAGAERTRAPIAVSPLAVRHVQGAHGPAFAAAPAR